MANDRFDLPLSVFIVYRASSLPESGRGSAIPLHTVRPHLNCFVIASTSFEIRLGFLTVCHHQPPRSGMRLKWLTSLTAQGFSRFLTLQQCLAADPAVKYRAFLLKKDRCGYQCERALSFCRHRQLWRDFLQSSSCPFALKAVNLMSPAISNSFQKLCLSCSLKAYALLASHLGQRQPVVPLCDLWSQLLDHFLRDHGLGQLRTLTRVSRRRLSFFFFFFFFLPDQVFFDDPQPEYPTNSRVVRVPEYPIPSLVFPNGFCERFVHHCRIWKCKSSQCRPTKNDFMAFFSWAGSIIFFYRRNKIWNWRLW